MFKKAILSLLLVSGAVIFFSSPATAASTEVSDSPKEYTTMSASVRWNNDNWFTTPHPEPETFFVTAEREIFGTTTTGIPFSQTNVESGEGFRVQKFVLQDHYHYIINGIVVYASQESELATAGIIPEQEGSLGQGR